MKFAINDFAFENKSFQKLTSIKQDRLLNYFYKILTIAVTIHNIKVDKYNFLRIAAPPIISTYLKTEGNIVFKNIYPNSSDKKILILKQILNEFLQIKPPLQINESLDNATIAAVIRLKRETQLSSIDGIVDEEVWDRIILSLPTQRLRQIYSNNNDSKLNSALLQAIYQSSKYHHQQITSSLLIESTSCNINNVFGILLYGIQLGERKYVKLVNVNANKGSFAISVDNTYQGISKNFQYLQKAANTGNSITKIHIITDGEKYSFRGLDSTGKLINQTPVITIFKNDFDGYAFFEYLGGQPDPNTLYSVGNFTEIVVNANKAQSELNITTTIHHELKHAVLSQFGKNVIAGSHPPLGPLTVDSEIKIGDNEIMNINNRKNLGFPKRNTVCSGKNLFP